MIQIPANVGVSVHYKFIICQYIMLGSINILPHLKLFCYVVVEY